MCTEVKEKTDNKPEVRQGCGYWSVLSQCEKGIHKYAKKILCGKEWCPECGKNDSAYHKRKIVRILPKVLQIKEMGYIVIEFPEVYRKLGRRGLDPESETDRFWCYSKKDLRETTNSVIKVLAGKRTAHKRRVGGYFKRGLLRWHWFGDKIIGKYNPHMNILVDSGYMKEKELNKLKDSLRNELNCPDLIVNYSYADEPAKKYHLVKYITRSTFHDRNWDQYMSQEIYNFRNQRWWGEWTDDNVWDMTPGVDTLANDTIRVMELHDGICPCCNDGTKLKTLYHDRKGKPVLWTRPVDSVWLLIMDAKEIGGSGYYEVPDGKWIRQALE